VWLAMRQPERALTFFEHVKASRELNQPALLARLAECCRGMGDMPRALDIYRAALAGERRRFSDRAAGKLGQIVDR
jgi:Tetratricopeptide repeat